MVMIDAAESASVRTLATKKAPMVESIAFSGDSVEYSAPQSNDKAPEPTPVRIAPTAMQAKGALPTSAEAMISTVPASVIQSDAIRRRFPFAIPLKGTIKAKVKNVTASTPMDISCATFRKEPSASEAKNTSELENRRELHVRIREYPMASDENICEKTISEFARIEPAKIPPCRLAATQADYTEVNPFARAWPAPLFPPLQSRPRSHKGVCGESCLLCVRLVGVPLSLHFPSIMGTRLQCARNRARSSRRARSKDRHFVVCDEGTACLPCAARCYLSDRKKDLLTL